MYKGQSYSALHAILLVAMILWTSAFCFAQSGTSKTTISGIIKDNEGEPVAGAFVFYKGTKNGVSSDVDGHYSIAAPSGEAVLVFQYIGMETIEKTVSEGGTLNVVLKADNQLESAYIVGAYGTAQRREDMVGSAFQISSEVFENKPKTRVESMLEGLIPGLSVAPNADYAATVRSRYNTRVRGDASLSASSEPLWIVDGVQFYTGNKTNQIVGMSSSVGPLSFLDPDDIESITVLKDADQTTIYGSNGSNGVILITTKSGSKNAPLRVSAKINAGLVAPDKSTMFKVMNAAQYLEVAREAWANSGYSADGFPFKDNDMNSYSTTDTRWYDEYIGLGDNFYANVTLSSGTKKVSTYNSVSYYREDHTVKKDKQQRFTFSSKNTFTFNKYLDLTTNINGSYNVNDIVNVGKEYLSMSPVLDPYNSDGTYRLYYKVWDQSLNDWSVKKFTYNSIPSREEDDNTQKSVYLKANAQLGVHIIEGLSFTSLFDFDITTSQEDIYHSKKTLSGIDSYGQAVGYSHRAFASYTSWQNVERLNFDRKFGRHNVGAVAVFEMYNHTNKLLSASGQGFMTDNIKELAYADDATIDASSNTYYDRRMSLVARASYSYDSRYYISGNFRRDGNSNFGKYARWSNFWSVGLSWNIHKEPFFRSGLINMLKLKGSYGIDGNSRIDASVAKGSYSYSDSYAYGGTSGARISSVPNPGLSWETTAKLNVGARIELKNILDLEIEYYNNTTRDLLSQVYVSRAVSADKVYANIGRVRNQGIEIDLKTTNIRNSDFAWYTTLNLAHNRNRILELYNDMLTSYGEYANKAGYEKHVYYLVQWAGVDPTDGSAMWYDAAGNLTKTYNTSNRVLMADKSRNPTVFGGLVNDLEYKNFTLTVQMNYSIGGWALATYASNFINDGYDIASTNGNQAIEVYKYRWTTPGQAALLPKVSQVSTKSQMTSTRYLYNKTNFDITNVALSYSVPHSVTSKMKIRGMSISLVCDNVYLFSLGMSRKENSYKTMMYGYPRNRTFTLGLNFQL
ncbi:MAG: SusC/RagA family TonB-linked outer membrane protein [Candidatus Cryptobacteroides sp.]